MMMIKSLFIKSVFAYLKKLADFSLLDFCLLILYIRDLMHVTIIIKKTCIYLRVYKDLPPVFLCTVNLFFFPTYWVT